MHTQNNSALNESVSIFIIDDHPIVIEGIQSVIKMQSNYHVCGYGSTIQDALYAIQSNKPTLIISDITLDEESGIDLIHKVKKICPTIKILMMSMHDEIYYIEQAFWAGANGYILKSDTSDFLIKAICSILEGNRYLNEKLEAKLLNQVLKSKKNKDIQEKIELLTEREKDIFQLIGRGKSAIDIANQLNISWRTVDSHKQNIKKKLNINSMNEVLEVAIEWSKVNAD